MIEETCCECGKEMMVPETQIRQPLCSACATDNGSFYDIFHDDPYYEPYD